MSKWKRYRKKPPGVSRAWITCPLPSSVALVSDRRSRFSTSFFLGCQKLLVAGLSAEGGVINQLSAPGATFCRWSIDPCVAATGFAIGRPSCRDRVGRQVYLVGCPVVSTQKT